MCNKNIKQKDIEGNLHIDFGPVPLFFVRDKDSMRKAAIFAEYFYQESIEKYYEQLYKHVGITREELQDYVDDVIVLIKRTSLMDEIYPHFPKFMINYFKQRNKLTRTVTDYLKTIKTAETLLKPTKRLIYRYEKLER